ncbi:protein-export chaperone SecB [Methylomarinum sp. Ch1-1]|uniref:Protein-export chaperone SecB n=1 Tax=Methylomarinum roseum TaxID=3067653 RepID=A0AAU7NWX5_9GAMM
MQISLRETKVEKLEFYRIEELPKEDSIELGYSSGFSNDHGTSFIISFNLSLKSKEGFNLSIEYIAFFETDEELTEEFKNSHFTKENAPAIAYPFLRSFISTLTVNSGYGAVLLPTINFHAMANQE